MAFTYQGALRLAQHAARIERELEQVRKYENVHGAGRERQRVVPAMHVRVARRGPSEPDADAMGNPARGDETIEVMASELHEMVAEQVRKNPAQQTVFDVADDIARLAAKPRMHLRIGEFIAEA